MLECRHRQTKAILVAGILLAGLGIATPIRAQYDPGTTVTAPSQSTVSPIHEEAIPTFPVSTTPADTSSQSAASNEQSQPGSTAADVFRAVPESLVSPERIGSTVQLVLTMTVLSLAPAILLMTTSFIRITVVLGLLRQAIGIQQLPSNQVVTSIAMFMTLLVMTPVWTDVYNDAISPYTDETVDMSLEEAWNAGVRPVRRFMSRQIRIAENQDDIWLFFEHMPEGTPPPEYFEDVPLQVLLPAFMLSELKVAFSIGFQIYLPFLILDIVVSSVTISMGMVMLPPTMISLPFKLMLFVLVDGWSLIVGMLLESFAPYS